MHGEYVINRDTCQALSSEHLARKVRGGGCPDLAWPVTCHGQDSLLHWNLCPDHWQKFLTSIAFPARPFQQDTACRRHFDLGRSAISEPAVIAIA